MGDIKFIKTNGGLGRTLPSEDPISALVFYNDSIPNILGKAIWATGVAYLVGDIVYVSANKNYYKCITANTAGATFAGDIAKWSVYTETVFSVQSLIEAENLGLDSVNYPNENYHISEYFRIMTGISQLYIYIFPVPVTYTFEELKYLQLSTNGKIRQCGIFANALAFATTQVDALQVICNYLETNNMPMSIIYGPKLSTIATIAALPDLRALSTPAKNVSVCALQDGDAKGFSISATDYPSVGNALGCVSFSKVNESIGRKTLNIASTELNKPILTNGIDINLLSASDYKLLKDKGYLFGHKLVGYTGTFYENDATADALTSDYRDIHSVRTIDKVQREVRKAMIPLINQSYLSNPGGKLSPGAITTFKSAASAPLSIMQTDTEISGYSVYINPNTNVVASGKIEIEVKIRPNFVSEEITVILGYTIE